MLGEAVLGGLDGPNVWDVVEWGLVRRLEAGVLSISSETSHVLVGKVFFNGLFFLLVEDLDCEAFLIGLLQPGMLTDLVNVKSLGGLRFKQGSN